MIHHFWDTLGGKINTLPVKARGRIMEVNNTKVTFCVAGINVSLQKWYNVVWSFWRTTNVMAHCKQDTGCDFFSNETRYNPRKTKMESKGSRCLVWWRLRSSLSHLLDLLLLILFRFHAWDVLILRLPRCFIEFEDPCGLYPCSRNNKVGACVDSSALTPAAAICLPLKLTEHHNFAL